MYETFIDLSTQLGNLLFNIVPLHNDALLVSFKELLYPFEKEAFRLLTKPCLYRLLDFTMRAEPETAQSLLRGRRCGNHMALDRDCKGDAEALQIQAVAQSVPLLLPYAAMHCRGAVAPLWTVVSIVCDKLQVSIGLAAKQNTWHCSQFHQVPGTSTE
jgi:hypothetical protein